jgi:hypothetical protein
MPGRFKNSGIYYISEWGGNDANAGTDPLLPRATLTALPGVSGTVVIGAGVYKGSVGGGLVRTLQGDGGMVILDGLGGNISVSNTSIFRNLWLRNFASVSHGAAAPGSYDNIYENIVITAAPGNSPFFYRSIFLPHATPTTSPAFQGYWNCIILNGINSTSSLNHRIVASYVAKNITVPFTPGHTFPASTFDNNCFNGKISISGIVYELKQLFDGSARPDADPGILDLVTVFPAVYTRGNFACVDPEFLDLFSKVVKPTSPLLKRSSDGYFIGAVRPGKFIPITDPSFQVTFTRMNTGNPDSAVVSAGQNDGTVRMTGKISESLVSSRYLGVRSILQFWKGAAGGTSENNNVPDAVKLLGLLPAEIDRPRRLTYLMRTSLDPNANQSSPDSIWDNDGATSGQYLLFEINTAPAHIGSPSGTRGNGDPRATGGVESPFNFRSVDIIFLLDNARV